jgi:hypothetical protein
MSEVKKDEPVRLNGPWSRERVDDYLAKAVIPLRIACVSSEGWPVVASLWYLHHEGALWCATPAEARVARLLGKDPRCGFEVGVNEPPYQGVRGRGRATLEPKRGHEILSQLVERYLGGEKTPFTRWLLER